MPADTLITTIKGDMLRIPDSLFHDLKHHMGLASARNGHSMPGGEVWVGIMAVILIVTCFLFLLKWKKNSRVKKIYKLALEELNVHYQQYDTLLSVYNSYCASLSMPFRRRFLERVTEFMKTKKFTYVDIMA